MTDLNPLVGARQSGESDNAVLACNEWLRMGPGRSLSGLAEKFNQSKRDSVPTQSLGTLQQWSKRFQWAMRAVEFDANWDAIRTEERERELAFGLALDYERVRKLKRLSDFLEAQIYELSAPDADGAQTHHNVWLPDVKQIGSGDDAERVDLERFNSPLFTQYRETLNDLAKEVGGRVAKSQTETELKGSIDHTHEHRLDPEQHTRSLEALANALGIGILGASVERDGKVDTAEP